MALTSGNNWEVRTAGNDTNGGGFLATGTGIDYSQQDSANPGSGNNQSGTGAIANGTTTISGLVNITTDIDGNIVYLAGGTGTLTAGWYLATFASSTSITVDRNVAAGTGITINIGGAFATVGQAISVAQPSNFGVHDTIYIKAGTYTITTALSLTFTNDSGSGPLAFEGYQTTRGDNGTKPIITCTTNSVNLLEFHGGVYFDFNNIAFTHTATIRGDGFHAKSVADTSSVVIRSCLFDGCLNAIYGNFNVDYSFNYLLVQNTEIKNCTGTGTAGAIITTGPVIVLQCFIHDNAWDGISILAGGDSAGIYSVIDSILYNNGNNGVINTLSYAGGGSYMILLRCDFANNVASGFSNLFYHVVCQNCIFDSNGTYGLSFTSKWTQGDIRNNAYYNNTTSDRNNFSAQPGEITLTGSPFTNKAGGDFSLNNIAGAGLACQQAGYQYGS